MTVRLLRGPRRSAETSSATRDPDLAVRGRRGALLRNGLVIPTERGAGVAVGGPALPGDGGRSLTGVPGLAMAWRAVRLPKGRPATGWSGATFGRAR